MSLSNENGNGMVMPVGPMYGNGGFNGMNDGNFFWYFIMFFFFMMFGGWGNGYGFGGGQAPTQVINNDLQRGFDQASINNNFAGLEGTMNALASSLQNCCCENRLASADLKYTIANEACADRQAVTDALTALTMQMNSGFQGIFDKMCQLELDSYKTKLNDLQMQNYISTLKESQTAQTAAVIADNANQTATLRQALNPTPIPAYVVANPNGCNCGQNYFGGCMA